MNATKCRFRFGTQAPWILADALEELTDGILLANQRRDVATFDP